MSAPAPGELERIELELIASDVDLSTAWARRARRDADRRARRRDTLLVVTVGLGPIIVGVITAALNIHAPL
jgi:hypothetical protein